MDDKIGTISPTFKLFLEYNKFKLSLIVDRFADPEVINLAGTYHINNFVT